MKAFKDANDGYYQYDGEGVPDWAKGMTPTDIIAIPLTAIKTQKWEAIKTHRDYISGHSVQVGSNWFHSDTKSRLQQVGLVMMGAGLPAGLQWKKLDGVFITMTPTLAGQIFQTTAMRDQAVFAVAETHRIAMEASNNPSGYDFSTGWPAIYTE